MASKRRWLASVQAIPRNEQRPVERPAVVGDEQRVSRNGRCKRLQQSRLRRVVRQQQLRTRSWSPLHVPTPTRNASVPPAVARPVVSVSMVTSGLSLSIPKGSRASASRSGPTSNSASRTTTSAPPVARTLPPRSRSEGFRIGWCGRLTRNSGRRAEFPEALEPAGKRTRCDVHGANGRAAQCQLACHAARPLARVDFSGKHREQPPRHWLAHRSRRRAARRKPDSLPRT